MAAAVAAAAAAAAAGSSSGGGVFVEEEGKFSEREVEVAAILAGLQSVLRARFCGQRLQRPEIPSWGRRRRRTVPAAGKPVAAAAAGDSRGEGAASPDTPLAFPDEGQEDDDNDEEREDEAAAVKKARAHEEWVQEQRGVVASLSHENAHLLKQIEEFRARLQSSRSTNDSLKKIQSKHKKRPQREENGEEEARKRKLPAHAAAAADRPALGLDLNEPVAEAEPVAAAQWCHHRGQMSQHKAALTAAARRRRQLIRRAKAAARRAGRGA